MSKKPEYIKRYENMKKNSLGFFSSDYEEYESLVLKKEHYLKDASAYRISYMKHFGDLMSQILATKFECIRLKKTITYCMSRINSGEEINMAEMEKSIESEMKSYFVELKDLVDETNSAKKSTIADDYSYEHAKKLFREIAKKIHPDINPRTEEIPELLDIWNEAMKAYYKFDYEKLEELKVILNRLLKSLGDDGVKTDIPDLKGKIAKLEKQINEILGSKPYIYKDLVSDKNRIIQKKEDLKSELEEYQIYQVNLEEKLAELMTEGGGTYTWQIVL